MTQQFWAEEILGGAEMTQECRGEDEALHSISACPSQPKDYIKMTAVLL